MVQQQDFLHTGGKNLPHRRSFSHLLRSRTLLACTLPILLLGIAFAVLCLVSPLPKDKLHRPSSTLVYDRNGRLLRAFTASDDAWRMHCDLSEPSSLLMKMVVAYEDHWFRLHPGINPVSIVRAAITNIRAGRIVCGGSTLTMQIARMMEPKERTLTAKSVEAFRALQLELFYSKDELLELYFNLAPYGGNIEGIASAAQLYFGKPVKALSVGETALLTALPNSPTKLRPDVHPDRAHMHITSTIDLRIQDLCLSLLRQHLTALRKKDISNGAVVVLDNRTHNVLAMVGSADFFEEGCSGQVNGALAPRSPGSALKPFVYTAALDQGLILERSILEDVPVNFSGYRPVNYDERYHGVVTARQALMQSLNVPRPSTCARCWRKRASTPC